VAEGAGGTGVSARLGVRLGSPPGLAEGAGRQAVSETININTHKMSLYIGFIRSQSRIR
jgi:hypothetical protein